MQLASAPLALPRFSAPACGRRGGLGLARPDRAAPAMAARLKGAGAGRDRHGNADLVLSPAESRDLLRPKRFALHAWHALERTKSGGGACQAMSTVGKSTNIVWHECPVGSVERQKLLRQKGCVIWVTGLSGSGKSTLACALSRILHYRGFLSYVLDGDNVRHGLNKDLSFKPEDRAENIRRIGEVAKLFADAGVICIASLISPYRRDRDGCRALLPAGSFIEVFMNMPLEICEARDSKGLYKLARAGKITGFTGIDDPYEAPQNCEIVIEQKDGRCPSPSAMAEQVVSYLEKNGYLQA